MEIERDGVKIALTDTEIYAAYLTYRHRFYKDWVATLYEGCTEHEFGDELEDELLEMLYEEYMDAAEDSDGIGEAEHEAFEYAYERFKKMMGKEE